MALDSGIPAGMTKFFRWLKHLYNQENARWQIVVWQC